MSVQATATAPRPAPLPHAEPQPAALFNSYTLGGLPLANRMVLSSMTRSRAIDGNVPSPLAPHYYVQRASAGLILTEATQVSPQGVGYIRTPGMHSAEQVAGWRAVTDAVHAVGGSRAHGPGAGAASGDAHPERAPPAWHLRCIGDRS